MREYLEGGVYPYDELPPGLDPKRLPGLKIERLLGERETESATRVLTAKLEHSCRKICMMCYAADRSWVAEREFYETTLHDSPALFGHEAVELCYHLEAFILFARSSLDVAAAVFGMLLMNKRLDSFNDLTKMIVNIRKSGPAVERLDKDFVAWVEAERNDPKGWLPVLCGDERGRALRDKIVHQTGFPIDYEELFVDSEKEYAVVRLSRDHTLPLGEFLDTVRDGVIANFIRFEDEVARLSSSA